MLKAVAPITHGNGIAKVFDADFINRDIAVIRLTLHVFHVSLQKVVGFNMAHGSEYIALDFFVASVKLF